MKNHPLYKKFKQIVLDGNYTIEQVENADFNQVAELLGTRSFSLAFLNNMKRGIIMALQNQNDEADMQQLRLTAMMWLNANFPDWQSERGREDDKPFVTIWLKGKPQLSEEEPE